MGVMAPQPAREDPPAMRGERKPGLGRSLAVRDVFL